MMIWECPVIIKKSNSIDKENADDLEIIDLDNANSGRGNTITRVIHGSEKADRAIIEFVNRTREKIDSC
jgi:uncharacterized protein YpmB